MTSAGPYEGATEGDQGYPDRRPGHPGNHREFVVTERIESTHSIWLFDSERMRFRRLPKDADPDAPALDSDWERYFALEIDDESGAFTVALNEDKTRLLRSWRESDAAAPTDMTGEVSLAPVEPAPDA